ncbi:hypothetical protein [Ketogulonicigenium vulgare]|uniref:Phage protein, HK97 gp10 family n=1 Tax=Ketogulonicigenium vulgare (strain WSH-001) TaxID=759362 RepID=F9YA00_KETVW|nr:hypothetical protein [Ketogulonicigenium vulgare]ADO43119.1 phage protein, HK97, gp10 [Ketogulonicigenium vulgare Y25]AEM41411.1 hypothetical protein KVU_1572 [Ketogulonicigenium vulgare WSH-001]ALJ82367.1 hypothetical protein KVH_10375 [Ketogulonicigenium vulgare]AOZ55154.1 phage protein, HK97, gp10 [Ketogulonicigenium vulgare]
MRRKLRTHAKAAIEAGRSQARKEGEEIASLARAFAGASDGDLAASIRVEEADAVMTSQGRSGFIGVVVRAGNDATIVTNKQGERFQNAKLQEVGTQSMPAKPFFNPAKRLRRKQAMAAIRRAVRKAWKEGG